jgi:hypothetical protein
MIRKHASVKMIRLAAFLMKLYLVASTFRKTELSLTKRWMKRLTQRVNRNATNKMMAYKAGLGKTDISKGILKFFKL